MNKKIYKIGISGSYGGMNLGDEAILSSIIAQLRQSVKVHITVFTLNPEDTLKRHKVEKAVAVRDCSLNEIKPEIEGLDLFILGGGGILYDAHAGIYLREVIIAREKKVPVMLYAIGAGPLDDPSVQKQVAEALNGVEIITVRDRNAQRILENIGVTREITVTADPALLLKPQPLPDDFMLKENFKSKKKIVGLSVREPGAAAPDLDEKNYHTLLADAADYIVDRLDADVIFIPMERKPQDLQHAHSVIAKMLKPQNASILKGDYTSEQMLSVIGKLDFAVGMRLHFLIFAALQNVPFVALPYSSKVDGFLEAIEIEMPPLELVNAGRLIAYIDHHWDEQKQVKKRIKEKLPEIQKKSAETNKLLLKLLQDKE